VYQPTTQARALGTFGLDTPVDGIEQVWDDDGGDARTRAQTFGGLMAAAYARVAAAI